MAKGPSNNSQQTAKGADKPGRYGRKGQEWHPNFIEYMEFIANHEVYTGMPDAFREDGTIQWETPSNRQSGIYQDSHHKRRDWWRNKAAEIGIDIHAPQWISKVAKTIHPTKRKPCKRCGLIMELRYAYPSQGLLNRVRRLPYVNDEFELSKLEHVTELVTRLYEQYGDEIFTDLPSLLKSQEIYIPDIGKDLTLWVKWLENSYIPSEPRTLSPGAMSNAPDRFDGFHSFNLCCRGQADTGRHSDNLRSYTTDRRVFEYWAEGDWIAADRLMGEVRSRFRTEGCLNGHIGPCDADHIGPISLGFCHRPDFQLLCSSCNSAKNNRMTFRDVRYLRELELKGESVVSWYASGIWNARKKDVIDEETALRISKLLRDNRQTALAFLNQIAEAGHCYFLISYLGLSYAEFDVEFKNLQIVEHRTHFDEQIKAQRTTKYALEQKARRVRVAFEALRVYSQKENRNAYLVKNASAEAFMRSALAHLQKYANNTTQLIDEVLYKALVSGDSKLTDTSLGVVLENLPTIEPPHFILARQYLQESMANIAAELSGMWNNERYVRRSFTFPEEEL